VEAVSAVIRDTPRRSVPLVGPNLSGIHVGSPSQHQSSIEKSDDSALSNDLRVTCSSAESNVGSGGVQRLVHCRYTVLSYLPGSPHLTVLERPGVVRVSSIA